MCNFGFFFFCNYWNADRPAGVKCVKVKIDSRLGQDCGQVFTALGLIAVFPWQHLLLQRPLCMQWENWWNSASREKSPGFRRFWMSLNRTRGKALEDNASLQRTLRRLEWELAKALEKNYSISNTLQIKVKRGNSSDSSGDRYSEWWLCAPLKYHFSLLCLLPFPSPWRTLACSCSSGRVKE